MKLYSIAFEQIERSLRAKISLNFMKALNEVLKRMDDNNQVRCTAKDIQIWLNQKCPKLSKRLPSILKKIGFWVSFKRSHYMINPLVLNKVDSEQIPTLVGVYKSLDGIPVEFDMYVKSRKDFSLHRANDKMIEIEVNNLYERTISEKQKEKHKMNERLIKTLTNELDEKNKTIREKDQYIKELVNHLTGMGANLPKLTLVKTDTSS